MTRELSTWRENWRGLLREPLAHFVLLGAALFGLYTLVGAERAGVERIVIDDGVVASIAAQYSAAWGRPPDAAEMRELLDTYIEDEIYYREGLAMGLDRDDQVVRRRMRQKVSVVAEEDLGGAEDFPAFEQWFEKHRADYREQPRLSFQQLFFATGAGDASATKQRVEQVRRRLADGAAPNGLGDASLLPVSVTDQPVEQVARQFGSAFADAATRLPSGAWAGPVQSGFGSHLVLVTANEPGRQLPLEAVRPLAQQDYEAARRQANAAAFFDRRRQAYQVEVDADLPAGATPSLADR